MFLLLPTCDTHARIAEISAALLARHWPDHPPLHVLHHAVRPRIDRAASAERGRIALHDCGPQDRTSWLQAVSGFLRTRGEELFLLLLDDYAMCGPARTDVIAAAERMMRQDHSVGLFALSWYPAAKRVPRPDRPGIVTLTGTPILLQAAIWRREWFVSLAGQMDPRAGPWGFEAAATQIAKRIGRDICAADIPEPAYLGGHLVDAFDKSHWPLPYHNLMHRGQPDQQHRAFLSAQGFDFPSRGLGDTIARLARMAGAAQFASALQNATGRDCGCDRRREALNRWVPYDTGRKVPDS